MIAYESPSPQIRFASACRQYARGVGGILADDMVRRRQESRRYNDLRSPSTCVWLRLEHCLPCTQGLGKTVQTIAFVAALLNAASDALGQVRRPACARRIWVGSLLAHSAA